MKFTVHASDEFVRFLKLSASESGRTLGKQLDWLMEQTLKNPTCPTGDRQMTDMSDTCPTNVRQVTDACPTSDRGMSDIHEDVLLARCVEADNLPGDGNVMQAHSNAQLRRMAQKKTVLAVWNELVPGVSMPDAKLTDLVSVAGTACRAYRAIKQYVDRGVKKEFPAGYVVGIARNLPQEAPQTPKRFGPGLEPWTEEDEQRHQETQKLVKELHLWEGYLE